MKNVSIFKTVFVCLLLVESFCTYAQTSGRAFVPTLNFGKAILVGKIEGISENQQVKPMVLTLNNPITAERLDVTIPVKPDGTFTLSVTIPCISIGTISSDNYTAVVCLLPGEETKVVIALGGEEKQIVVYTNSLGLTAKDVMELIDYPWVISGAGDEILTPELFSQRVQNKMVDIVKSIEANEKLSAAAKQIVISETSLMCVFHSVLNYSECMAALYEEKHKDDSLQIEFHPQVPDKSYYTALRYFRLNDPMYLSAVYYPMVLQVLLSNETLAIPAIGETPIDRWMVTVKDQLKDILGTDSGLVYDLLASNSFSKQLTDMKPLSEVQKRNISSYYTDEPFAAVLLNQNQNVIAIMEKNSKPSVSVVEGKTENLMDSIIAKLKGKVVFVDFWATWCSPCLKAMEKTEEIKPTFANKDVVFVYVSNYSSPRLTWEKKISQIDGEHFYVTKEEWAILSEKFDIDVIPHYLIYDKTGKLKYNHNTFMGVENMRKWIEELL